MRSEPLLFTVILVFAILFFVGGWDVARAAIDPFAMPIETVAKPCPSSIEKSQFLPDRNVTPAADNFITTRHHDLALGKCGGVKGRSRRQPVRAAQPLRP